MRKLTQQGLASALSAFISFPATIAAQGVPGQREQYEAARDAYRQASAKASADRKPCFDSWAEYYQCLANRLGPTGSSLECERPTYPSDCPAGATGERGTSSGGNAPVTPPTMVGSDPGSALAAALAPAVTENSSGMVWAGAALLVGGFTMMAFANQPPFATETPEYDACMAVSDIDTCKFALKRNPYVLWGSIGAAAAGGALLFTGMNKSIKVQIGPHGITVKKVIRLK